MGSLDAITIWAIIADDSSARMHGEVNLGRAIEITHVLVMLKELSDFAKLVNEAPGRYDQTAQMMAILIAEIERAVTPTR